uniref:Uncharacterized protein n=1 Tax=Caenorhabditis japonica TaxID=281687 RepID=A0A8R1IHT7_CAEJA
MCYIFESIGVFYALTGQIVGVPSSIVLALHGLYRLQVQKASITSATLASDTAAICEILEIIVRTCAPSLINGSKFHQLLYHLPRNVAMFGSLIPFSTQVHEHSYHVLKRHLASEVTNGLGASILRNSSTIRDLESEVRRRVEIDEDLLKNNIYVQKLAQHFHLLPKNKILRVSHVPEKFRHFSVPGDLYMDTIYFEGVRYSSKNKSLSDDTHITFSLNNTTQYGRIEGFIMCSRKPIHIILSPFKMPNFLNELIERHSIRKEIPATPQRSNKNTPKIVKKPIPSIRREPLKRSYDAATGDVYEENHACDEIIVTDDDFNLIDDVQQMRVESVVTVDPREDPVFSLCPFVIGQLAANATAETDALLN